MRGRRLKQITQSEWNSIPECYKGMWTQELYEFRKGDFPSEWIGRKTMLDYDPKGGGTVLLTEGVSFVIIPDTPKS